MAHERYASIYVPWNWLVRAEQYLELACTRLGVRRHFRSTVEYYQWRVQSDNAAIHRFVWQCLVLWFRHANIAAISANCVHKVKEGRGSTECEVPALSREGRRCVRPLPSHLVKSPLQIGEVEYSRVAGDQVERAPPVIFAPVRRVRDGSPAGGPEWAL